MTDMAGITCWMLVCICDSLQGFFKVAQADQAGDRAD